MQPDAMPPESPRPEEAPPGCYCGGRLVPDAVASSAALVVARCVACGYRHTVYRGAPDRVALQEDHPSAFQGSCGERFGRLTSQLRAVLARRRARRLVAAGASRTLDYGCGQGYLLDALRAAGAEACGIEISDATARRARACGHVVARDCAAFGGTRFDAVVAIHVLEHLPEPRQALDALLGVLEPGAIFQFEVPNAASWQARLFGPRWLHCEAGLHVHHFTPQAFAGLLEGSGYRVQRRETCSLEHGLFGWIQSIFNLALPYNRFFRGVVLNRPLRERLRCWPEILLLPLVLAIVAPLWIAECLAGSGAVLRFEGRVRR